MAYQVVKKIKGKLYLYEQESYREGGKVRTRCRCLGRVDGSTGELQTEDVPAQGFLDCSVRLDRYKINRAALEEEQATFTNDLTALGIDTKSLAPVCLRYGRPVGYKATREGYTVKLPRWGSGNRTKFKRAYREALARAGLDLLREQKPAEYARLRYAFSESYRRTQDALNAYILNTNDRNRAVKALIFRTWGVYRPTYKNPLSDEDLGLTGRVRKSWEDEFCGLMADRIQRGASGAVSFWSKQQAKAQNSEKWAVNNYKINKETMHPLKKLGGWLRKERKAVLRANARVQAQAEIQRKLTALRKVFGNYNAV